MTNTLNNEKFAEKIMVWYKNNRRQLPWRETENPYFIWLSEIILQQTRVAQGLPYYYKLTEAFPTLNILAEANIDEVLRYWQGLGYYSRGRSMHETAQLITNKLNGVFPKTYIELLKLKGIGPYTAAAIASFAFGEKVAVVDGNVYRVLARIFGIDLDILSNAGKKKFAEIASNLLPNIDSASYNQAIMEFGALYCTPKLPKCNICPFIEFCYAFEHKNQNYLPVKIKTLKVKTRQIYYFIIDCYGKYYLRKRDSGIWQGLFEFYPFETENIMDLGSLIEENSTVGFLENAVVTGISDEIIHKLTHQTLSISFVRLKINSVDNNFYFKNIHDFYSTDEIESLPKPKVIANYFYKYLV